MSTVLLIEMFDNGMVVKKGSKSEVHLYEDLVKDKGFLMYYSEPVNGKQTAIKITVGE